MPGESRMPEYMFNRSNPVGMICPPSLSPGDKIAIVAPASVVKNDYIDGAARFFASEGFEPIIMPYAKGPASGSYAAPDSCRLSDLVDSYSDPAIRAILCARGGYGCNHLLSCIKPELIADNPKWLIGFSDVSALHALSEYSGVISLHSPMAKHLTIMPPDHYCTRALMDVLKSGLPINYKVKGHNLNVSGCAKGKLIGGNLAVINGLAATPFDPCRTNRTEQAILLIEDIGEQIYEIERMLLRLRMSGRLDTLSGLIVGSFTEYREDPNHADMNEMIHDIAGDKFPIAFGFPVGHTDENLPMPIGATTYMTVDKNFTALRFE